jgi:predicted RNA binding protein YcfA (HicA-like mRNA interferase family)
VAKLPLISWRELAKFLTDNNFEFTSQSGSHIKYTSRTTRRPTVFPKDDPIARGTLRSALMMAGLEEEFDRWYNG